MLAFVRRPLQRGRMRWTAGLGLTVLVVLLVSVQAGHPASGGAYQVILTPSDQTAARRVLRNPGFEGETIRGGFTAVNDASLCRAFHPRRGDLVVTGAASATDSSAVVNSTVVKVFRTARMALADWRRSAASAAAQRCRLALARSTVDIATKVRRAGLGRAAPHQIG